MKTYLLEQIKKNTEVYTIQQCKIEKWYVKGVRIIIKESENIIGRNIAPYIYVDCEHYNNGVDFCERTFRLSELFLTKEELIAQLDG